MAAGKVTQEDIPVDLKYNERHVKYVASGLAQNLSQSIPLPSFSVRSGPMMRLPTGSVMHSTLVN
jgi:hypothetical protein